MKTLKRIGKTCIGVCIITVLVFKAGCIGDDFLGLEDYQRDLLFGGLATALLLGQQGAAGDNVDPGAGTPVPGPQGDQGLPGADGATGPEGEAGLSCWDLDGDGIADPEEDANSDGDFDALDCQGETGATGPAGEDGEDGQPGLACWDLDGDGSGDASEDKNGDGNYDTLDCQGATGPSGGSGAQGPVGPAGPSYFDMFVEDFFTTRTAEPGDLTVDVVRIDEPLLGAPDPNTGVAGLAAYRMALPQMYDAGNDVTMRLFIHRTGPVGNDCFVFTVNAARLVSGYPVGPYGETRWVRVNDPTKDVDLSVISLLRDPVDDPGLFIVIDLPVNSAAGLDYPDDLDVAQFLAFELGTFSHDEGSYHLLGVEFFESAEGTAWLAGAVIFDSADDITCE
ncbi:MAG: hypothetical protein JSU63_16535 [Phycisphaerales bacterium]|nr:MAG: hypothetical protein JSU63_16535 [Phycisphaerales bacterium]